MWRARLAYFQSPDLRWFDVLDRCDRIAILAVRQIDIEDAEARRIEAIRLARGR